jgi:hypothetical protein
MRRTFDLLAEGSSGLLTGNTWNDDQVLQLFSFAVEYYKTDGPNRMYAPLQDWPPGLISRRDEVVGKVELSCGACFEPIRLMNNQLLVVFK